MSESKQRVIKAQFREKIGKGHNRKLREKGGVPAVIYGSRSQPAHLFLDRKTLKGSVGSGRGTEALVRLSINGTGKAEERLALLKEIQRDPLTNDWLHVDFLEVYMDQPITLPIPIVYEGKAKGIVEGGIVEIKRRELEVSCLPDRIPSQIVVDVSELDIGGSIHVGDIKIPDGVTVQDAARLTLVTVVLPGKIEEETPAAEGEAAEGEAAEGEAAEGAVEGGAAAATEGAAAGKESGKAQAAEQKTETKKEEKKAE